MSTPEHAVPTTAPHEAGSESPDDVPPTSVVETVAPLAPVEPEAPAADEPSTAKVPDPDAIVEDILRDVGPNLVVGLPLGLGKANHVINALLRSRVGVRK